MVINNFSKLQNLGGVICSYITSSIIYTNFFGFQEKTNIYHSDIDIVYPQLVFPIVNINVNDVATGIIKFKRNVIKSIDTITKQVYVAFPFSNYWRREAINLQVEELFNTESYIDSGRQFIRWRFDPSSLSITDKSVYYVLFLKVNKINNAFIGQAYIEIVIKILDNLL